MLSDNKEIANAFNKFYIQVAKNLNNELTSTCIASLVLRKSKFDDITEMKIIPVLELKYSNISWVKKLSMIWWNIRQNFKTFYELCK